MIFFSFLPCTQHLRCSFIIHSFYLFFEFVEAVYFKSLNLSHICTLNHSFTIHGIGIYFFKAKLNKMKLQRKISLIADVSVSSNFTWERMVYNVQNCLSLLGFNCFMTDERFQTLSCKMKLFIDLAHWQLSATKLELKIMWFWCSFLRNRINILKCSLYSASVFDEF